MITAEQYQKFLKAVVDDIEGDWVLVGGALIAILNPHSRATADIDLCPIGELSNERRIHMMKLAESADLSLESLNPSADFFLRQIPQWTSSIVVFIKGKKGTLYRPSLELYIKLKVSRLSESDVTDCLAFIEWHRGQKISYDKKSIQDFLLNQKKDVKKNVTKLQALDLLISNL